MEVNRDVVSTVLGGAILGVLAWLMKMHDKVQGLITRLAVQKESKDGKEASEQQMIDHERRISVMEGILAQIKDAVAPLVSMAARLEALQETSSRRLELLENMVSNMALKQSSGD